MICHYWFFNYELKFQDSVYYGCHVFIMLDFNISNFAIITIKNFDYCCIVHNFHKSETIDLLENSVLKFVHLSLLKIVFFLLFCFSIYKMVESMDIFKSLNINIGTVMKNPKMVKSVPNHLKTKKCVTIQLKNYLTY